VIRYIVTFGFTIQRFNDLTWRSQSPQPNAENCGDYQRDPAYADWYRVRSDGYLGLIDQSHEMADRENTEDHAGNA